MNKLKKLLTVAISLSLLITTIPANSFSASYTVLPQHEFDSFAKITSANFCQNSPAVVINIQDLHSSKEVQKSIFKLLEKLNNKCENVDVYLEGASDFVDYNKFFSEMKPETLSVLMNALYEDDKISGAEFFGYKANKVLQPTEQKNIYDRNIQNYAFLIKNKKEIEYLLSEKYSKIKTLDKYLTKEQRKFLKIYNAYLNKKISAEKFYKKVSYELNKRKISPLRYINTKLYTDVLKANKKINQTAAKKQLQSVLSALKNNISYQDYVNLLQDSKNLSDINVIFAYLSANINPADKITEYPDLFKLISLREISSLIDPLDLIDEEKDMVEDILLSYAMTVENRDVVYMNLFFQTYKKLLLAAVSSKEYDYYKQNNSEFVNLYSKYIQDDNLFNLHKYVAVAESFNELNFERNKSFVDNLALMSEPGNEKSNYRGKLYSIDKILSNLDTVKDIKVIISGGFHTEGINELLRQKNISYITLTPNVKETDLIYEQNYLDSIVKQAEADINAISKKPFTEEEVNSKADKIILELNKILEYISNKGINETNEIIQNVIEQCGVEDIIKFNVDSEGVAKITVDGKVYALNYEKGRIELQGNLITSLGKNIKTLIKQVLKNKPVRIMLGLRLGDVADTPEKLTPVQKAEERLVKQNILLTGFDQYVLRAIFGARGSGHDKKVHVEDYGEIISSALSPENLSSEFSKAKITINKSSIVVGTVPDGYGNTEEYGSLFSVVWKNENGVLSVKEILISEKLLIFLQKNKTETEIRDFFDDLFMHERLEILALAKQSRSFNDYVEKKNKKNKEDKEDKDEDKAKYVSYTSDDFHEYIRTEDFKKFLEEFDMDLINHQTQIQLLDTMDTIISEINEEQSAYSNVISVSSIKQGEKKYSTDTILNFLRIRSGDESLIARYNSELINKIVAEIAKEYEAELGKENGTSGSDTVDVKSIINKFVVSYRKGSDYIFSYGKDGNLSNSEKFVNELKKALIEKFKNSVSDAEDISVGICELKEEDGSFSFDETVVKGKRVLFVEDIISKQSSTFNNVYNALTSAGAGMVLGTVFFDLSKETEETESLSDVVYEHIKKNPQIVSDVIKETNGNVQKYLTLWLVRLYEEENSLEVLKQALNLDDSISEQLQSCLIGMITNNNLPKGIKPYQIFQLVYFIEFGEKDIFEITKSDMDAFRTKIELNKLIALHKNEPLEANFSDWEEGLENLIVYACLMGYEYIDLAGISNVKDLQNKKSIETICSELGISFTDRKTKMKHSFFTKIGESVTSKKINEQKEELKKAREKFEKKVLEINEKYGITDDKIFSSETDRGKYLDDIGKVNNSYRDAIKGVMLQAKSITKEMLLEQGIDIDDDLFTIIVGGSFVKENMMSDSDIYYDILCPDGSVSKSINDRFAPLYSSVLKEIGLNNYHVLKYSSARITDANIGTFVDSKEIVPFFNYVPLLEDKDKDEEDENEAMYLDYMKGEFNKARESQNASSVRRSLNLITRKYFAISKDGKGWLGNSFYVVKSKDGKQIFSDRLTLMALQSKLNEIIFDYYASNVNIDDSLPISVKEQIDFIKNNIAKTVEEKEELDKIYNAYRFLSSCRYLKGQNTWTNLLKEEERALKLINDFVSEGENFVDTEEDAKQPLEKLLSDIETFVWDNSTDIRTYRNGYDKYGHLEKWKQYSSSDTKNNDVFVMAQIISLLIDIDSKDTRDKLKKLGIADKDLNFIFESLDSIKTIEKNFPDYVLLAGERSVQNYWDGIAITAKNPETLFALIAHKLTSASFIDEKTFKNETDFKQAKKNAEDLMLSVYLPLSKRFGNADIYEYVRNTLLESIHPAEYLNVLGIIKLLYGVPYSQLKEHNEKIRSAIKEFLINNDELSADDFDIKIRVKTLYSFFEKLTSSRRKENEIKKLSEEKKKVALKAIKDIVTCSYEDNEYKSMFESILEKFNPEGRKNLSDLKEEIITLTGKNKLTSEEEEFLSDLLREIRVAVFSNHKFKNFISHRIKNSVETDFTETKKKLAENNKFFELWFFEMLESELRDVVGLHIVVEDEKYDDVIKMLGATGVTVYDDNTGEEKKVDFPELKSAIERKGLRFSYFGKDDGNKQARLKINAGINSVGAMPIPVEACFYTETDKYNEDYGIYNLKKISAPHFIYKMGANGFVLSFLENIFYKVLNYGYVEDDENAEISEETDKDMIFYSDALIPTGNLADDFNRIVEKSMSDTLVCFVEYEGKTYVQCLPSGSTIYDLATGRYFSDDINVSVFDEQGEMLSSDYVLDNAGIYKVLNSDESNYFTDSPVNISVPDRKARTIRGQLIQARKTSKKKSSVSSFIEDANSSVGIREVSNLIVYLLNDDIFKEILNDTNLSYEQKADKIIAKEQEKNKKSDNAILQEKASLVTVIKQIDEVAGNNGFDNILTSAFIKRSTQIANQFNLSSLFELFEAVEYGIIKIEEIKPFYNMCVVIKTKKEDFKVEETILPALREKYKISKVDTDKNNYNLIINGEKFFAEDLDVLDSQSVGVIYSLLDRAGIKTAYARNLDENDGQIKKQKDTVFIAVDFVQPNAEEKLPLRALGNNVEQLIRHNMMYHDRIVMATILNMTSELANQLFNRSPQEIAKQYEAIPNITIKTEKGDRTIKTEEGISALIDEYPELMAQILLGLSSRDSHDYDDKQEMLSKETPYLTQEDLSSITEVEAEDFSEFSSLLEKYGIDIEQELKMFSNKQLKVSGSLDLVDGDNIYAFATMEVDSEGNATFYIGKVFLRKLSKLPKEERQKILKQIILHEIIEHILTHKLGMSYEKVHEELEQIESQKKLMDKAKELAPEVSRVREQMLGEIYGLIEKDDFVQTDADKTVAFMFGNLNIDSFIKTYKLYRDKQVGRIFISGNIRGSLDILKILRDLKNHPEYKPFFDGVTQDGNATSVRTVRDVLSLSGEEFDKLNPQRLEEIEKELKKVREEEGVTDIDSLKEFEKMPLEEKPSKDEIFWLVSKDGLSEAAIIKWIMLESARQEGLTRKEIIDLIKSMHLEKEASNTPQNIKNIFASEDFKDFIKGKNDIDVIIIQNPFSQTRAKATLNRHLHENGNDELLQGKKFYIHTMNFDDYDLDYYTTTDKLKKSLGEWTRLIAYTLKGDIVPVRNKKEGLSAIPADIFEKNVLPLLTILNDEEKGELKDVFGFLYDKKTGEIKDEFLQIIGDSRKKELEKILNDENLKDEVKKYAMIKYVLKVLLDEYRDKSKKDKSKESDQEKGIFKAYSYATTMDEKEYDIIIKFIDELFSDSIEQRQVEMMQQEKKSNIAEQQVAEEQPDITVELSDLDNMYFEKERLQKTHDLLAAA